MSDTVTPTDDKMLVAAIDENLARLRAEWDGKLAEIATLDAEQNVLGYHPNRAAYFAGGMLAGQGFGAGHILAVAGFHALCWRDALERLERADEDDGAENEQPDLLVRLRRACETDPMLEFAGHALLGDLDLLKRGRIDPFWLRRPKLGLGQAAKAFGLEPEHANAHRGLYALPVPVLCRGFEKICSEHRDKRFGALLLPLIETGGERLARIGAAAIHADAEARYREDCARFAAHQRATPDRRWRTKPALARQGHLAVTTAKAKNIAIPSERTRGRAADWLDGHDANIRFGKEG